MTAPVIDPRSPVGRLQSRGHRRPNGRVVVSVLAAVMIIGGVVWALWFSSLFRISGVEVHGTSVLSADAVIDAAGVPIGEPLVTLDGGAAATRVSQLPPVASVSVRRSWPSTVVIEVVERQPALVVPAEGGFEVLDADGVPYLTVLAPPAGVPVFTQEHPQPDVRDAVLRVVADLPDDLAAKVTGIRAKTTDSIELDLADGKVVVWGSAEDSARKASVLAVLMKQPGRIYIVSAPDTPAVRP